MLSIFVVNLLSIVISISGHYFGTQEVNRELHSWHHCSHIPPSPEQVLNPNNSLKQVFVCPKRLQNFS